MQKQSRLIPLLLVLTTSLGLGASEADPSKKVFHWHLLGLIGDYPVQMDLTLKNGSASGSYFYERRGGVLELNGETNSQGGITIRESLEMGSKPTGVFSLEPVRTGVHAAFKGQWRAPGAKKALPVTLAATVAFRRTYQSKTIDSLYVEEPVWIDQFRGLASGGLTGAQETEVIEPPAWDEEHGIRFQITWHRPDTAISILRVTSENVAGSRAGQGKADYGYDHFHYRIANSHIVPLRLEDFFEKGTDWKGSLSDLAQLTSESPRQFSFDAVGLRFHGGEWMDQDKGQASWMALSGVLKPGWPLVLGIEPMVLYTVPAPGSKTRAAILAAAAKPMQDRLAGDDVKAADLDVRWRVNQIRVQDGWAMISAEPQWGRKGSYEVAEVEHSDDEDPSIDIVLRLKEGQWAVFKIIEPPAPEIPWKVQLEDLPQGIFEGLFPPGYNP